MSSPSSPIAVDTSTLNSPLWKACQRAHNRCFASAHSEQAGAVSVLHSESSDCRTTKRLWDMLNIQTLHCKG